MCYVIVNGGHNVQPTPIHRLIVHVTIVIVYIKGISVIDTLLTSMSIIHQKNLLILHH